MKLDLNSTAWNALVNVLVARGVIASDAKALAAYRGKGQSERGFAFLVPNSPIALLQLGAALAEAFTVVDALMELDAPLDLMTAAQAEPFHGGPELVVFFPGHRAQAF